ncbi:MAG: xanthine dehydrogenase molybdenum-binding subunit XdhA [Spirochaetaceae bacterium]|jgi:xanthine dehydrogenase molybdenum-binding subunit|nr:xanthine dehydrogenase molybdenum-binding subunit XdhA [Spirochaetaceae bacterium]
MSVGQSIPRVDAWEKVSGRAKYTDDLVERNALIGKILHSTIANGLVTKIHTGEAEKITGVVKIITCFDVPDFPFPTAGHPWSTDPAHWDPMDRRLLNRRVRLYGDDIAAVIAEDEAAASRALKAITVEYEEYPVVLTPEDAMKAGAPLLHEECPNNILKHTTLEDGNFEEAIQEEGLLYFEDVFETPIVQHCHLEPAVSFAYMEQGRIVIVASTQIPHIIRRIVGQALGIPWGKVRVIKPWIGGGFGNKQDSLYEPLNAYMTTQVGGRLVKLELSREEVFAGTRVRHGEKIFLKTWARPNGRLVARSYTAYSNQGAYGSHGHGIAAKGTNVFRQLYRDEKARTVDIYTVYTNTAAAGAMRGYGTPQAVFAVESHMEDIARALNLDPLEFRFLNLMPVGFTDPFTRNVNYFDSFHECVEKGKARIKWDEKREQYKNQRGPLRRGVGMSMFWYNTAVWPISIEVSSCRMVLNQDGSVQVQLGETEIGQGADTVYTQMTAETLGVPWRNVHVISTQDTDITPFGTGAYGSRQTYVGGAAVHKAALLLKEKIIRYAAEYTGVSPANLDISEGNIINKRRQNKFLAGLEELATDTLYHTQHAEHLTAETTAQVKSNAFSLGCAFAEVEVDIPLGKIKLLNLVNCHDCGTLINPLAAEGQVHGGQSMAIGFGMFEQFLYDPKTGKLLNGNLLDYKLPTILDHPRLNAEFVENPEPTSAYGTKALGEPPTVPGAPAVRNAVLHATGVAVNRIPMTPHVLFEEFKKAGLL